MLARDVDLLLYEPTLFREVMWAGQELFAGEVPIAPNGNVIQDVPEPSGGVSAGYVVVVDGVEYVALDWENGTKVRVLSLHDWIGSGGVAVFPANSDVRVRITTFRPQLSIMHEQLLHAVGLVPGDVGVFDGGTPTAGNVVNVEEVRRLEALGALHLIHAAASAIAGPEGDRFATKAEMYRGRFERERQRVRYELDLDGDGVADAARRPTVTHMIRGVA